MGEVQTSKQPAMVHISATEAARNFAELRRHAHEAPVIIASHNRDRQVLLDYELYEELCQNGNDRGLIEQLNAKLTLTLDSIDTYVCLLDQQCRVRRLNIALVAALSRDHEDLNGLLIEEVFAAPSFRYVIERIHEVIDTQVSARFEQASPLNPDRTLSFRIKPWPGGVGMFADDVTERSVLREERARTAAMRAAADTFCDTGRGTVDSMGSVTEISASFLHMLDARKETVTGSRFISLFAPRSRELVEEAMCTGEGVRVLDVEYLSGGVSSRKAKLALSPYWNGASGHSHGFVIRDY